MTNTFGFSIEIKRQETLSVNTWWRQCEESSRRTGRIPILLYRQNRKVWQCVTNVHVATDDTMSEFVYARATIEWESFLQLFEQHVKQVYQNS